MSTSTSERLHLAIFGRRNSGKSSLVNALTGQQTALVSATPGTTTDPVSKPMEMPGLGPVVLIDTAGFDDEGMLGMQRVAQTRRVLDRTDMAILLMEGDDPLPDEVGWQRELAEHKIPTVTLHGRPDLSPAGLEALRVALLREMPEGHRAGEITGELAHEGDVVMLVMPQDAAAPKGRLILPQVQTIRELLDKKCSVVCCTPDRMEATLGTLTAPPHLIITDSQAFATAYGLKPADSLLTSFSVLFARYKGDIDYFVTSAAAIGQLTPASRILIAEACTHAPLSEDIGRVKIPAMLRKHIGEGLRVDLVSGTDFPSDLTPYDLVIHCGACMFNRRHVLSRVAQARSQHVPMTNYGITIAYLQGILDKIEY